MRRLISIKLLFLFLLNVVGYYGVFIGWHINNEWVAKSKLDQEDYSLQQMVTIKVPISLPYPLNQNDYERVDGQFEYQNEFYRLVKQKLERDTLYVICIKDEKTKEIHQALNKYVKTFSDSPANTQSTTSNGKTVSIFIKDYMACSVGLKALTEGWVKTINHITEQNSFFEAAFIPSVKQPPRDLI